MEVDVFRDVVRFLAGLEPIHQKLADLYAQRTVAVATSDSATLLLLADQEQKTVHQLQQQLQQRGRILATARRNNLVAKDLRELLKNLSRFVDPAGEIDAGQYQQTVAWMRRTEQRSWELRRSSWSNWHAVQKGLRHMAELRGLLASSGDRSAANGSAESRTMPNGGVLIDTSI